MIGSMNSSTVDILFIIYARIYIENLLDSFISLTNYLLIETSVDVLQAGNFNNDETICYENCH